MIARIADRAIARQLPRSVLLSASTSDGASNEQNAGVKLTGNHITCYAHTLQLIVVAGLERARVSDALKRLNDLIAVTLRSKTLRHKLRHRVARYKEALGAFAAASEAM